MQEAMPQHPAINELAKLATESNTPKAPAVQEGVRRSLLTDTATAHIRAITEIQEENRQLHDELMQQHHEIQRLTAKLELTEEALRLSQRQVSYYMNFSTTLCTKINDAAAIMTSALEEARTHADVRKKLEPLSPEEEHRLAALAAQFAPEQPNDPK